MLPGKTDSIPIFTIEQPGSCPALALPDWLDNRYQAICPSRSFGLLLHVWLNERKHSPRQLTHRTRWPISCSLLTHSRARTSGRQK